MNLGKLIDEVGNILDYNPDVPEYREQIRSILNDIYLSLFEDRKWKWAQKEIKLHAFNDVVLPINALVGSQITLFNDFNGPIGSGTGGYYAYVVCPQADVPYWLSAGCIISITSGTTVVGSNPLPNVPADYWITNITLDGDNNTKCRVYFQRMDKDQQRLNSIYERTPRIGNSNADIVCTFKHRYITLPQDCVAILGIGLRETVGTNAQADLRPFDALPKYMEEQYAVNMDERGRPTDYIPETDYYVKPPMIEPIATVTVGPVIAGLRAPFAGKYQVCYTHVQAQNILPNVGPGDRQSLVPWESAPSPISDEVVPSTVTQDGVNITNMQVSDVYDGLYKRYYIRVPNSDRFYATEDEVFPHTTTSRSIYLYNEMLTNAKPLPEAGGVYQRIRLYPRQDSDYVITLRYLYRPQRLVDDQDCPDVPASGHKYLVYRVCEEAFIKHNNLNQAKMYKEKADKELLNLENRWLTEANSVHVKKPFAPGKSLFDYRYASKLTKVG